MAQTIQLEQLPETARHELLDFYEFLMQKYVLSCGGSSRKIRRKQRAGTMDTQVACSLDALVGIWKGRSVTLEELRKSAWQRKP